MLLSGWLGGIMYNTLNVIQLLGWQKVSNRNSLRIISNIRDIQSRECRDVIILRCLEVRTAPHGPVLHWCDWGLPALLRSVRPVGTFFFRESGLGEKPPWSLERDGHWGMAHSCSVAGWSSGSHSVNSTTWSLMFIHTTWRVVVPWPQDTEHCKYRQIHFFNGILQFILNLCTVIIFL